MKVFEHDTLYYGYDILSTINKTVSKRFSLDRGGIYIWQLNDCLVYYDSTANDYCGCLEVHKDGALISYICTVLNYTDDGNDLEYNENKIINFLKEFK